MEKIILPQKINRHYFRRLGVGKKLFSILSIQILIAVFLYIAIISLTREETERQTSNLIYQLNDTLLQDVHNKANTIGATTKFPVFLHYSNAENDIFKSLLAYNKGKIKEDELRNCFDKVTSEIAIQYPLLNYMLLFNLDGDCLAYRSTLEYFDVKNGGHTEWYQATRKLNGGLYLFPQEEMESPSDLERRDIFFGARTIIGLNPYQPVGVFVAAIDTSDVYSNFEQRKIFPEQKFSVYSDNGRKLFGSVHFPIQKIEHTLSQNQSVVLAQDETEYIYHMTYDKDTKTYSVIQTPYALMQKPQSTFQWLLYIVGVCIILVAICISVFIVSSITKPLQKLVVACEKIGAGNFSARIDLEPTDELGYLTKSFNTMSDRLDTLVNKVYLKDIKERELELQVLRSQINPHFLYNTLEGIRMAAYLQGAESVAEMSRLLANVLRYGVTRSHSVVKVEDEIRNLEEYIQIQTYRFQENIRFSIQVDHNILSYGMIKLLLQPLVENAVVHGGDFVQKQGHIQVWGYRHRDNMVFSVSDNGIGISESKLIELRKYIQDEDNETKSMGLKNVHRRIQLYYGDEYGIQINSQPGKGTCVTLTLPIIQHQEELEPCIKS